MSTKEWLISQAITILENFAMWLRVRYDMPKEEDSKKESS